MNDPIVLFQTWFTDARKSGLSMPEAMVLATATPDGRPSARWVLLKDVDEDGRFQFYTNLESRKAADLGVNPRAALALYWEPLHRQVRIEGPVEPIPDAEADAYWTSRPRASQLAALASDQSAPLANRTALVARWRALARRYRRQPVPRPRHWTGYRVVPRAIEFWIHRDHRLHDRELFTRTGRGWKRVRLQP